MYHLAQPTMRVKRYIKLSICLMLTFFAQEPLTAQENFLPAYVVMQDGDSIKGFIDYRNWLKNPVSITYRERSDTYIRTFTTTDILAFGVKDERYVSATVNIETSSTQMGTLDEKALPRLEERTVFLQTIFDGVKSLYHYKDENSKDHFYIEKDGKPELLIYKKYQNGKLTGENKGYLTQLQNYLLNCERIDNTLRWTRYSKKDLEKLFNTYYGCTNEGLSFKKEVERSKNRFGLMAGFTNTKLEFRGAIVTSLTATAFTRSTDFAGGLFYETSFVRGMGKLTIENELMFSRYSVSGEASLFNTITRATSDYYTEISLSYIKLNNLLRYKFYSGDIALYANAGVSNGFAVANSTYERQRISLGNGGRTAEGEAIESLRVYEQGLIFGVGAQFSPYGIELRVERGNGMLGGAAVEGITTRIYLLMSYDL